MELKQRGLMNKKDSSIVFETPSQAEIPPPFFQTTEDSPEEGKHITQSVINSNGKQPYMHINTYACWLRR